MMQTSVKEFFRKPSTFAYASLWAMVPKLLFTFIIAVVAWFLIEESTLRITIIALAYPSVGFLIDMFLYVFRDRIWQKLPDETLIPSDWKITAADLEKYAKNLPKIRFIRIISVIILLPIFIERCSFDDISITFGSIFLFATICDGFWLKILRFPKLELQKPGSKNNLFENSGQNMLKQMDATIPGTVAWTSMQNINSMGSKSES